MIRQLIDLPNFINTDDSILLETRLREKRLMYFQVFEKPKLILQTLRHGVYLFINCFMEIAYIGYSKDMQSRIRKHEKYENGDTIIAIMTYSEDQGEVLETQLVSLFLPKRNKIRKLKGKRYK